MDVARNKLREGFPLNVIVFSNILGFYYRNGFLWGGMSAQSDIQRCCSA